MHYLYYLVSYRKKRNVFLLAFEQMNRTESRGPLFSTIAPSTQQPESSFKTRVRPFISLLTAVQTPSSRVPGLTLSCKDTSPAFPPWPPKPWLHWPSPLSLPSSFPPQAIILVIPFARTPFSMAYSYPSFRTRLRCHLSESLAGSPF